SSPLVMGLADWSGLAYIVLSFASGWAAARRFAPFDGPAAAALAFLVLSGCALVLPVHALAALQLAGAVKTISPGSLCAVQAAIAALLIGGGLANRASPWTAHARDVAKLPRYVWASGAVLAASYVVFLVKDVITYPDDYDALWYHIPTALRWAQTGSLRLPDSRYWQVSFPGNAE